MGKSGAASSFCTSLGRSKEEEGREKMGKKHEFAFGVLCTFHFFPRIAFQRNHIQGPSTRGLASFPAGKLFSVMQTIEAQKEYYSIGTLG